MSEVNIYLSKPDDFISQVSVVAAWINFQNEYLFLQKNAQYQEAFHWGVPGGKIELKEEPIAALQREIFEETKVNLIKSEIRHVKNCYISKPGWNYTYHMFYCNVTTKPSIEISLEHNDYKWIKVENIMKLPLMIGTKETLELFLQEGKKLGLI